MMIYTQTDNYRKCRNYNKPSTSLNEARAKNGAKDAALLIESTMPKDFNPMDTNKRKILEAANKKRTATLVEARINTENAKFLREAYLINTLSDIFLESLVLDEEFKEEHKKGLKKVFAQEMAQLADDADDLLNQMSESKSYYLNELSEAIRKKATGDAKAISDGSTTKEECADDKVQHMDTKDGVEAIKSKVLKTIKSENELSSKDKQISDEIEKAQQVNESYRVVPTDVVKKYSLFKALMVNTYKQSLSKVMNESYSNNVTVEGDNISVNKDNILAESIIKYTVLETFNTLRLKNYTPKEIRNLSDRLAYKRIK